MERELSYRRKVDRYWMGLKQGSVCYMFDLGAEKLLQTVENAQKEGKVTE